MGKDKLVHRFREEIETWKGFINRIEHKDEEIVKEKK